MLLMTAHSAGGDSATLRWRKARKVWAMMACEQCGTALGDGPHPHASATAAATARSPPQELAECYGQA